MSIIPSRLYAFDIGLSSHYLNENKELIKASKCYDNVWNLINLVPNNFDVLFCFVEHPMLPKVYFRHCVFVNEENKIIDVTLSLLNDDFSVYNNLDVVEIKRFSKLSYLNALSKSLSDGNATTDLEKYLKHDELSIKKVLAENNKFVIG